MAKKIDGPVPWAWEQNEEDRVVAASGRSLPELFYRVTGSPLWYDGPGSDVARRRWRVFVKRQAEKL